MENSTNDFFGDSPEVKQAVKNVLSLKGDTRKGTFIMLDENKNAVIAFETKDTDREPMGGYRIVTRYKTFEGTLGNKSRTRSVSILIMGPLAEIEQDVRDYIAEGHIPGIVGHFECLESQVDDHPITAELFKKGKMSVKTLSNSDVPLTYNGQKCYMYQKYHHDIPFSAENCAKKNVRILSDDDDKAARLAQYQDTSKDDDAAEAEMEKALEAEGNKAAKASSAK